MSAEKRARELLKGLVTNTGYVAENFAIHAIKKALTPQWEPISTAPRDGTCILVRFHSLSVSVPQPGVMLVCWDPYYAKGGNGWDGVCDGFVDCHSGEPCHLYYGNPTKWLPLPAPPEGEV